MCSAHCTLNKVKGLGKISNFPISKTVHSADCRGKQKKREAPYGNIYRGFLSHPLILPLSLISHPVSLSLSLSLYLSLSLLSVPLLFSEVPPPAPLFSLSIYLSSLSLCIPLSLSASLSHYIPQYISHSLPLIPISLTTMIYLSVLLPSSSQKREGKEVLAASRPSRLAVHHCAGKRKGDHHLPQPRMPESSNMFLQFLAKNGILRGP
eukprot:sb/3470326/